MLAKVLTIAQQKGGAGKTTLTAQIAVAFAAAGRRVALIDVDPQASLSRWYKVRTERPSDGLPPLTLSEVPGWKLATEIDRLKHSSDLLLIDSPPHAETEAKVAVRCAALVLVPVQPSPMDLWATAPTVALAKAASVPILVVLNRVQARSKLVETARKRLAEDGLPVARTALGNRMPFAASMLEGRSVVEASPKSVAASEIRSLAEEIEGLLA
ncbi:MAG: ParA family protein [Rhodospirillales bacterium]|nr:ParA family protein [Rhodospirillales bacterium]